MHNNKRMLDTSFSIGNVTIKNRLVRSATYEFAADNGQITPQIIALYKTLAAGGCGLLISGMQAVSAGAGISPAMVSVASAHYVEAMSHLVDEVHSKGSSIFIQLNHGGYRTDWRHGYDRFGVSPKQVAEDCLYHEMTEKEIYSVIEAFGAAAKCCQQAGCDGVQIHAAHGFLINSFLSPYFNQRMDCYGGTIENRARLLFAIYDSIRTAVGHDFPIGIKIPFSDLVAPSITLEESIWVCQKLADKGLDMIEVSAGVTMDGGESSFSPIIQDSSQEGKFLAGAVQIANSVEIPVISVGTYRSPDFIEKVLQETPIAAVALCRPLICEPNLLERWQTDRSPTVCVSCNLCYRSQGIISCQRQKIIDKDL